MIVAASAWDSIAAELAVAATGYHSVIAELAGSAWLGPSSTALVSAVSPYVSWLEVAAQLAEESAGQARAAAAAFEAAFATIVPPPVIAANRMGLMTLIATNFFGQNTAAIMATEAQYGEMWAQDAAAMYGYAAASAAATVLNPYPSPPRTTTPQGVADQARAVVQAAAEPAGHVERAVAAATTQLSQAISWLPTPATTWWGLTPPGYKTTLQLVVPAAYAMGFTYIGFALFQQTFNGIGTTAGATGAWYPTPLFAGLHLGAVGRVGAVSGTVGGPMLASAGSAGHVGRLSVPSSWSTPTTEAALVSAAAEDIPTAAGAGPSGGPAGPGNTLLRGMPAGVLGRRASGYGYTHRYGFKHGVIARPPSAG
jgi:PPE-repeat protein